jgi:hypothetical protein
MIIQSLLKLGLIVLVSNLWSCVLLAQVEDPFSSGTESKITPSAAAEARQLARLSKKPDITLAKDLIEPESELVFELGRLISGTDYLLELNIVSKLKTKLTFDAINASCGCLSAIPKELTVEPEATLPLKTLFRSPTEEGAFEKVVVLTDSTNLASVRVLIKGTAQDLLTLESTGFSVAQRGLHSFKVNAKLNFPNVDFRTLVYRINSSEFAGWRFEPTGPTDAIAYFDIVVVNDEIEQSAKLQVRDVSGNAQCEIPLRVVKSGKPKSQPSEIILRKRSNGEIQGKAIIQMRGLPDLVRDKAEMTLVGKIEQADGQVSAIELNAIVKSVGAIAVLAEVTLPADVVPTNNAKMYVEFTALGESFSVPMVLFKE